MRIIKVSAPLRPRCFSTGMLASGLFTWQYKLDNYIHSTIHSNTKTWPSTKTVSANTSEFNTYGVEWYPNRIVFTLNGVSTGCFVGRQWQGLDGVSQQSDREGFEMTAMPYLTEGFDACEGCDYGPVQTKDVSDWIDMAMRFNLLPYREFDCKKVYY